GGSSLCRLASCGGALRGARHARKHLRGACVSIGDLRVGGRDMSGIGPSRELCVGDRSYTVTDLRGLDLRHVPYSLRVVVESVVRRQGADSPQLDALLASSGQDRDVDLYATRVFLHDTNGVPTVVDLAAMRHAAAEAGADPGAINPLIPAELVIDHSVIVDVFGTSDAFERNVEIEYERNAERYRFLRWAQS